MGVRVTHEDSSIAIMGIWETCERCNAPTRYWWANGCMPLCQKCAKKVTRQWCIDTAKENGYGPLPSKQYRDNMKRKQENE